MKQPAHPTYPLFEPLEQRWSPKTFSRRPLEPGVLRRLLEAARWAPSCFNEQPWRFIVAARDLDPEGHAALSAVIVDKNRQWAQHAPVLMLSIASMNFARNGRANRWATHDTGQAVASMLVQATTEGLLVHQMGGFDQEAARQRFAIPEGYEPIAAIAVGYPPNADEGDPAFLAMDAERHRTRHSQDQFAFGANGFGTALTTPLDVHRVLEFWFGDIGVHGMSNATAASRWWRP
ncbi:MAG: nitroreductase family protein, partial [Myxococcota bacterium]